MVVRDRVEQSVDLMAADFEELPMPPFRVDVAFELAANVALRAELVAQDMTLEPVLGDLMEGAGFGLDLELARVLEIGPRRLLRLGERHRRIGTELARLRPPIVSVGHRPERAGAAVRDDQ